MRQHLKTFSLILCFVIGIPIVCCVIPMTIPIAINQWTLWRFANNLFEYPLPPNTALVEKRIELSHPGNGNTCLYQAELILSSTSSLETIKSYYAKVEFPRVVDSPYTSKSITAWVKLDNSTATALEKRFIVELEDSGSDVTLDIRCH
ncbi:MAG: hypothetical protein HZB51_26905 [Chloroflexi bacterium]|nr:hypothetical protein [Chloroflexota bacterium]